MRLRGLRHRWFLVGLGVVLSLLLSAPGAQGGDPRGAWTSNAFQILNVEPVPQAFTARFLAPDGQVVGVMTDTLPAGTARFYPDETLPIPPTFTGTLAVSAPGQVALEILHLGTITGGNTILEVLPEGAVDTVAHTPIDRCTVLLIHNLSPTDTAIVDLQAFGADGTSAGMRTDYIPPEGLLRVHPLAALGLPPDFAGSAVLHTGRPIQVTVLSICGGLSAFVAPSAGSTRLLAPHLPPSIPGRVTATLTIRNTGTTVAEGEVIFASGLTLPLTLPPAGSVSLTSPAAYFIYLPLVIQGGAGGGNVRSPATAVPPSSFSAIISTTAPVVAVVQVTDSRAGGGSLAYRTFALERASPAVALPILFAGYEGWWTGNRIWIRNVGEQPTDVQMRYVTVPTGTAVWGDLPGLGPGETAQVSMPPLPDGADRAAAILLADQPIVALAGAFNTAPSMQDRHLLYPGTNFAFNCIRIEEADFTWSPLTATVGQAVAFTGVVSPAEATTPIFYSWSFGDGTYGTGDYVQHTYGQAGTYVVAMTATNCLGFGQAVARYTLTVAPPARLLSSYAVLPPTGP
ncbi:MAG: PKD domain-containing protein [Chloroflexia bacterium]